ncbi:dihydrolipoyl dehydrogenase [Streptomyces sp. NPDC094447]|uniref:dihydrolipoyl dehydrogenase n=1 Tax=Streptomyces sp. NPDC094447 TaxID=3366062 RepID=UPI00382C4F4A
MNQEFDVVVIGGGPGGYVAAIRAAQLGQKVALVEKERPGGVCLNWGCIPTKAMLRSAEVLETVRHAADYGIVAPEVRLDYPAVLERRDGIVRGLTDGIGRLLEANDVTVIAGHARFLDAHTIAVHDTAKPSTGGPGYAAPPAAGPPHTTLTGRNIVIATGSCPVPPQLEGADLPGVITSDGAFGLSEVPRRIVVVGGSAIGAEWAGLLHAFGSEVCVVEIMPTLVPAEDVEIARMLTRSFTKRGIRVLTSHTVTGIRRGSDGLSVGVERVGGAEAEEVAADIVLFGIGRLPNTAELGLEHAGVQVDSRGYVPVDDELRTNVAHIHAIGDVTGRRQLAHVASHQGLVAAGVIAGHEETIDYSVIPAATFTHPEVASVGLTEAQAAHEGFEVVAARFPFAALGRAHTYGATEGMAKIVADGKTGKVLGTHIIGPGASDLIAESALALSHDATLSSVAATIHAHPTLGEVTLEAAMSALGLPVHAAPRRRRPARF